MDTYKELQKKSLIHINNADHLLTQTYPIVNDPKLLIAVTNNIYLAITNMITSVLSYEKNKKINKKKKELFLSNFNEFKTKFADKYKLDDDDLNFILKIKSLIDDHKNSPMEFPRKNKFIICLENYEIKELNLEDMKRYIKKTKNLFQKIEREVL